MEFTKNKETKITWMWDETCLALFIIDTEIQDLKNILECDTYLVFGDKVFHSLDEEAINFICANKVTTVTIVTSVDAKNYLSSIVRYIKEPDGTVDFDKIYIETTRDPRN